MARVLIVYESKHGQTEKIAKFLRDRMTGQGHAVELMNARHDLSVAFSNYDGVMVGAPIYRRAYPRAIQAWALVHSENLNRKPSAFFSVCMAVMQKDERTQRDLLAIAEKFFKKTGWYPKRRKVFAGAVNFTQYNWFIKLIMKSIAKRGGSVDLDTDKDYEYTKWDEIVRFSDEFVRSLQPRQAQESQFDKFV